MGKGTTIKEAIKNWEDIHGTPASEALEVLIYFQWPPIEKMDNSLSQLSKCQKLSLSTNMIDKISGLGGMKNLKILSLGRNYIKALTGLEPLSDTLEELWISYNMIEKLRGIGTLKKLKVLYMSNNLVKDWVEFNKLQDLPALEEILFVGNPICEAIEESVWRTEVMKRLPSLKKLDGVTCIHDLPQE
ncbi:dynein axonemal light chain 1-like [Ischnura elegans]|uniref:dynein axonemal light chain 1-like n=1 Tax=Ischnura elegans TaxID=197161 RepID=UPI001ED87E58|nr:dynein axonemal light chain 1-like [Ischnura elegans]